MRVLAQRRGLWHGLAMSLRKPGKGTRAPHGRGIPVQCALAGVATRIHLQPKCRAAKRNGEPCRKVALAGTRYCGNHGGFAMLANAGRYEARA